MNNNERLQKLNELEARAKKLQVAFPPIPSYSVYLNNVLKEEGAGKTIMKAYYKFILQYWMAPEVSSMNTVENTENMFFKSYDDKVKLMHHSSLSRTDAGKSANDFWNSVYLGYVSSNLYNKNIVIGQGVTGPDSFPINHSKLVNMIAWNKSAAVATDNLSYDPVTGIYIKNMTATYQAGASDADRTITEVGLFYDIKVRQSDVTLEITQDSFLFDRAELDTPITVKKTDNLTINYTIRYQVPWNTTI